MSGPRTLVGRNSTFAARETVWQTGEGFEVESNLHYEVARRRVLFDDVLLVTIHRTHTPAYLAITAVFAMLFIALGAAVAMLATDAWPASIPLFALGIPAAVAFFVRLAYGVEIITIFGRRSTAAIRFARKQRAREVYGQICAAVRAAQRTDELPHGEKIPDPELL
jgi:hypothetical protein